MNLRDRVALNIQELRRARGLSQEELAHRADVGCVRAKSLEAGRAVSYLPKMTKLDPFRYFKTSREIIRLAVMLYVRFSLSLRNVEDLLQVVSQDVV